MNTNLPDLDPLNTYDYSYGYDHMHTALHPGNRYSYDVKVEAENHPSVICNLQQAVSNNGAVDSQNIENRIQTEFKFNTEQSKETGEENSVATNNLETEDSKEDIKPIIGNKTLKGKKPSGKTSSYWSKKIADRNFPFYGCTICQVSFMTIQELDQHVTIHKGRPTSYDIRLRNQLKKKMLRKEKKKLKKLDKKIKIENVTPDIEIKPEDGYIGSEKTSEFNEKSSEFNENASETNDKPSELNANTENSLHNDSNVDDSNINVGKAVNTNDKEDPRLQKLFKCFACQKEFALSYYLKLHVRSHTDEKPYTCAECGQSFITASKLGRHNKRIHLAIRYQCRICYRYFSRFEYLTRHFDKKHPDDKLEGEPYDYNAILPYLKELEEELREKAEAKEKKPKEEDLWSDWSKLDHLHQSLVDKSDPQMDQMDQTDEDNKDFFGPELNIIVEDVKIPVEEEAEVKEEKVEDGDGEIPFDGGVGDVKEESFRDDSMSDDDYFPSNTWAATPKIEPTGPPSPLPRQKRNGKKKYPQKCGTCEKIINSASYMRVHLRTHTGERPFKCYICNRGFITSSKMHRHVLTHAETWGDGDDQVKLEDEVKVETDAEGGVDEEKNQKASIKKAKAKFNKKKKKGEGTRKRDYQKRTFACPFCSKRFLHKETMVVHKKSHEGEPLIFKCNFCLEVLSDAATLKEHEGSHTGPKPYLCTVCGRGYTKRETMIYHRKNHATDTMEKREYTCDICSKSFNAQCKLQRHLVGHNVNKFILRYECPVCAHMFNTKYHVQMHLATHQKEGLILEENRNEILAMVLQNARKIPKKQDAPVNSAVELIPADERSRVCNICGQVFQHFYYLEEHLKSHGSRIALEDEEKNEEKKHICKVCNKGFKLHYYLKLHSFTHTKEKPFICQQCGKGFITKGKLKRHLETHSGLKKYQCHICYKFFTRPSYLRIHVRTIHGTQDYNFRVNKQYDLQLSHHSV